MSARVVMYDSAIKSIKDEAHKQLRKLADDILADSQRLVPVDTGKLRDSGHVEDYGIVCSVVYDAPYAAYVEVKQPFLTPAATRRRRG